MRIKTSCPHCGAVIRTVIYKVERDHQYSQCLSCYSCNKYFKITIHKKNRQIIKQVEKLGVVT